MLRTAFICFGIAGTVTANAQAPVFRGDLVVPARKSHSIPFDVPADARADCWLDVQVRARGGTGNDIVVLVSERTSPGIVNRNALAYSSGQRPSLTERISVRRGAKYWLTFDNSFSVLSDKAVSGSVALNCGSTLSDRASDKPSAMPVRVDAPARYEASALQTGGVGSRQVTKTAWTTEEHGYLNPADNFVSVTFNGPGDLMWAFCGNGYQAASAKSPTGNSVSPLDPERGSPTAFGILIEDKLKNEIVLTCAKP